MGRGRLSSDFRQPVTFDVFYYFLEVKHKSSTVIISLRLFKQGGFAYSWITEISRTRISYSCGRELPEHAHYIVTEA